MSIEKFKTMEDAREEYPGRNYDILTDDEANDRCAEYIQQTLWAFNASFLSGETNLDQSIFTAIQNNGKCEDNNDAIESLVDATCGLDSLIESAISADGRGHFMSNYDGEETEILIDDEIYYLYKAN
jgi:hypothetical protein